jgi:hypothetical protein
MVSVSNIHPVFWEDGDWRNSLFGVLSFVSLIDISKD